MRTYGSARLHPRSITSPEQVTVFSLLRRDISSKIDCNKVDKTWCNTDVKGTRCVDGKSPYAEPRLESIMSLRATWQSRSCALVSTHDTSLYRWLVQLWIQGDSPSTLPLSPSPLWVNAMWAALINLLPLLLPPISPLLWTLGLPPALLVAITDLRRLWIKDKHAARQLSARGILCSIVCPAFYQQVLLNTASTLPGVGSVVVGHCDW
jgi:hypothetical protein